MDSQGMVTIGDLIIYYRKAKGIKQKDLAKKAGVGPCYLSQLENNKKPVFPSTLLSICVVLEITPADILFEVLRLNNQVTDSDIELFPKAKLLINNILYELIN